MTRKEINKSIVENENRMESKKRAEYYNTMVEKIRSNIAPCNKRSMRHIPNTLKKMTDDIEVLDFYYCQLINEVLKKIRKGGVGYVFTLEQVKDVLSFEPKALVYYNAKLYSFSVALPYDKEEC